MKNTKSETAVLEKIRLLAEFRSNINLWFNEQSGLTDARQLRQQIEQNVNSVRNIVVDTRCLQLVATNRPLPGRMVVRDCDPFNFVLETPYYGVSFVPIIIEMVDKSINVLESFNN